MHIMSQAKINQGEYVERKFKQLSKLWWDPNATSAQITEARARYEEAKKTYEEMN